jgi:hypothetical protein
MILYTTPTLAFGTHMLTIQVTDARDTSAQSAWVWVDAFETNGTAGGSSGGTTAGTGASGGTSTSSSPSFTRVEQTASNIQYTGNWFTINNTVLSGGSAVESIETGNRGTFTFTGTTARWVGLKDPWSGIANVYVDDVFQAQIDTYSSTQEVQVIVYTTPTLTAGTHSWRFK